MGQLLVTMEHIMCMNQWWYIMQTLIIIQKLDMEYLNQQCIFLIIQNQHMDYLNQLYILYQKQDMEYQSPILHPLLIHITTQLLVQPMDPLMAQLTPQQPHIIILHMDLLMLQK